MCSENLFGKTFKVTRSSVLSWETWSTGSPDEEAFWPSDSPQSSTSVNLRNIVPIRIWDGFSVGEVPDSIKRYRIGLSDTGQASQPYDTQNLDLNDWDPSAIILTSMNGWFCRLYSICQWYPSPDWACWLVGSTVWRTLTSSEFATDNQYHKFIKTKQTGASPIVRPKLNKES